ncbi:sugar ABC transporter substrate-binding protein [Amylibacter kogurei]|uniref:Sugar ABC transporter substrate-binding protein n=1 Tax=Paramylibacter kogurei TaxID=1889778 RepID=A0A2G5K5U5_9RHOB|nr:polysaccharide biosynthesis/export family protein [Amylibacter kogurei]PIB24402.1 sugar ABC transporter substrate-binding protein [Amylibacter kogurei]
MNFTKVIKFATILGVSAALAGCAILPRTGPNKSEIYKGSVNKGGNAYVIGVDDRVAKTANLALRSGFSAEFRNSGAVVTDLVRPGDVLVISVYENVEIGVLGTAGVPSNLNEIQVDRSGNIFIPYAGRIRAAGRTPDNLRRILTNILASQTPDPQVIVRRASGGGSSVSVIGSGIQGVYPIEQETTHLSGMLARAGGVNTEPEVTRITVVRGKNRGSIWLRDLYEHVDQDIHLRPGDRIIVEEDIRRFSVLGAISSQGLTTFPKPTMSALEAVAYAGGLSGQTSDPTGVFVIRDEPASVANTVLNRSDITEPVRMAYVLNLTKANGLFTARDFDIRDGDTLYVTEAPYYQFTKVLSSLLSPISTAGQINRTLE